MNLGRQMGKFRKEVVTHVHNVCVGKKDDGVTVRIPITAKIIPFRK